MERQHAAPPVHDSVGFRFDNAVLCEAGSWHYAIRVATDIIRARLTPEAPSSNFMPEGMRFEDDPAAEFEEPESSGGVFFIPNLAAGFRF
jgi:hypothetical protein